MRKDPGRLPQTSSVSEPLAVSRGRPSRWALRLFWCSVIFTALAIAAAVATPFI